MSEVKSGGNWFREWPRFTQTMILVALQIILLAGCGKTADSTTSTSLLPSAGVGNGSVNDSLGFAVVGQIPQISSSSGTAAYTELQTYQMTSSHATDINTTCEVQPSQSPVDMFCIAHVNEGDLYVNGMNLGVNLPTSMCHYLDFEPYYYWALPAGSVDGDTYQLNFNSTGVLTSCSGTTSGSLGTLPGTISGQSCAFAQMTFTGQTASCKYDYSLSDPSYPNCCEGTYTVVTTTATTTGTPSIVSTKADYGGKLSNCLRGPAMMNAWPTSKDGFPLSEVTDVLNLGASSLYKVPAPLSVLADSNLLVANMFGWSEYLAGTLATTLQAGGTPAFMPVAFESYSDADGHVLPAAHPYYEYRCLDENFEVINRIRLMIASWTTNAQYQKFVSTGTGTLDVSGLEGSASCTGVTGACDDFAGWDDAPASYPGIPY